MAFERLGKKKLAIFYFVVLVAACILSQFGGSIIGAPIFLSSYVIGWIHANVILSRYQSNAQDRIDQLDRLSKDQRTANTIMEKAILQSKVLSNSGATAALTKALQKQGGDAQLLNLAGEAMFAEKRYSETKQFFDSALSNAKDDALIARIKKNQSKSEKKHNRKQG